MISPLLAAMLLQTSPVAPDPAPAPPPPPCASEGHAGFDFWLGEWEVFNPTGARVGESRIERDHNGCAVIENWMPSSGNTGTSLNHYDPRTDQWHQKWIGSGGGAVEFSGGVTDGKMVLTGNWPSAQAPHQLIRMSYTVEDGGSVRQFGEASLDHGLTWQTSFDFLYRPKSQSAL
uniref:hypothetical protein n=1 Tax=Parerythrobacter lutipelagi TaxID=1964208 RepID=UPI0010F8D047|nr:hypothetical protein [Parerythrobacter lutipelagi]